MNNRQPYRPDSLSPFPPDLADSLLDQAYEGLGFAKGRRGDLSEDEKRRLDDAIWRLITAADVSDRPCHD